MGKNSKIFIEKNPNEIVLLREVHIDIPHCNGCVIYI